MSLNKDRKGMLFVGGGEMFDSLIRNGAYSELDASRLVRDTASALAFLHGIGVVHADLKPENRKSLEQQFALIPR